MIQYLRSLGEREQAIVNKHVTARGEWAGGKKGPKQLRTLVTRIVEVLRIAVTG